MSEIVATVTITLATLISMTIIGVYAIRTMIKIANKDKDKQQIQLFYLDFMQVRMNVDMKDTYKLDDVATKAKMEFIQCLQIKVGILEFETW